MNSKAKTQISSQLIESEVGQLQVIEFLNSPDSYGPGVSEVTRIDTHAAIIFLAGSHAYKIKREITLPYLDFSTLELRHDACVNELRINQPTAPEIYLDIISLVRTDTGKLEFGNKGVIVEWVLKMNRFDQEDLLAHLAENNKLDEVTIEKTIEQIIEFQNRSISESERDGAKIIAEILTSIIKTVEKHNVLSAFPEVQKFSRSVSQELALNTEYLRQRGANGQIRRCHGDLHLANIVLIDGLPKLFDAIEFDEEIARIDVLYDFAFLIMDLWHYNCQKLSNYVMNRVYQFSDPNLLENITRTLPIFLACRAGVRAMTALDKLSVTNSKNLKTQYDEAINYIELANKFLYRGNPCLIAIGGRSGSGKSTVAKEIAPQIGAPPGSILLRSDVYRKILHGYAPLQSLKPEAYSPEHSKELYETLLRYSEIILKSGKSVVVDASFLNPEFRNSFEVLASKLKVGFLGYWLTAPKSVLTDRVSSRENDASDANTRIVEQQFKLDTDPRNWVEINTEGSIAETLSKLKTELRNKIWDNF